MKKFLSLFLGISVSAWAHPGGHQLTCTSVKQGQQILKFNLKRANGVGYGAPTFEVFMNGKEYDFRPKDPMINYGETIRNPKSGEITVTADNMGDGEVNQARLSIKAEASSIKVVNAEGKPVDWPYKGQDACATANGKATFKGYFEGKMLVRGSKDTSPADLRFPKMDVDCVLEYSSPCN